MSAFAGNASASGVRNQEASLAPRGPRASRALALALIAALVAIVPTALTAEPAHVDVPLVASGDTGITGNVHLVALPQGGTMITVVAKGLTPGEKYLSLYYDNEVCEIEKYEEDDVIAHYTANGGGVGIAHGKVDDDLDEIGSVSVRLEKDFSLLACADVKSGK